MACRFRLVGGVAIFLLAAVARAAVIDFEDAPLGSYRSYILHGVRFSTVFCYDTNSDSSLRIEEQDIFQDGRWGGEFNPGTFIAFKDAGFTPGHSYGALSIPSGEGVYPGILAEFPAPISEFGVDIGSYGWPRAGGLFVQLLDADRMPVGEMRRFAPREGEPPGMVHLEGFLPGGPATYALVYAQYWVRYPGDSSDTFTGNSAYIDNLTYEPVPEPAPALLLVGALPLVMATRRMRASAVAVTAPRLRV
jgi:hypothetical protein